MTQESSHSSSFSVPRVGVNVMVVKDGKVLLGKRKGAHGEGECASPGGSLEMMESFAACAITSYREGVRCMDSEI